MIEDMQSLPELRQRRIEQISWQIANLRARQQRDRADGLDLAASRIGDEINALLREWHKLRGEPGEGSYADLDRSDPSHAEEHRKEISRLYREHHGLPALQKLGERCLADVRHEKERMREEWMPELLAEDVEWVKGE